MTTVTPAPVKSEYSDRVHVYLQAISGRRHAAFSVIVLDLESSGFMPGMYGEVANVIWDVLDAWSWALLWRTDPAEALTRTGIQLDGRPLDAEANLQAEACEAQALETMTGMVVRWAEYTGAAA